jgi:flavin-dependent dehydrogenase
VESVDVLVIGAGPAGTVAAALLGRAGFQVCMVEKEKFPRFVIGESLLPRCMEAFDEAGLLEALKKERFQEKFGAKFIRGSRVCDFNFTDQHTAGWTWTWQVPRARFDLALAEAVQRMGIPVMFETRVTAVSFQNGRSVTTLETQGRTYRIEARFVVDASGYGRVIPRLFGLDKPSGLPPRKALFAHLEDPLRDRYEEPNRIIIIAHEPEVWIWVIPFSNGMTSVGYVGHDRFFSRYGGNPTEAFLSMIRETASLSRRFEGVRCDFEPRRLEGWSVTTEKFYGDGFVLTGNVTEFLDPIFSSGVTLAVASSQLAARLVARHLQGKPVDWEREYMQPVRQGVDTFRSYVMGWYDGSLQDIFFSDTVHQTYRKQICSVLAGYVWDLSNPFVKRHQSSLRNLARLVASGTL